MAGQDTAAIILARGGSKGIPGKNLARVGGVPLVARSVRAARAAPSVAGVWVSTDDAEIAACARTHGAHVIDRPAALSTDGATSEDGWLHALGPIRESLPDVARLVLLQCTSPFTTGADIEAVLAAQDAQGAACALSVIPDHGFLWRTGPDGFARGTNHDETRQRQRRQDLDPVFCESGAIYTVDVAAFETVGRRFCGPVAMAEVAHPPLEIDSPADLAIIQAIAAHTERGQIDDAALTGLRAVVMDFDGVHTDDLVTTDQDGREAVRTSRSDGMGLAMLRDRTALKLMILSKERNPVVLARAAKLQIPARGAIDDKATALTQWCTAEKIAPDQVLYVGNDVNDLAVMAVAGLGACPLDAHPSVLAQAHWILPRPGGKGALRAMAERLMDVHG